MYNDRDIPWWRWIWWQKSLNICSKSHSPSPYFSFQTSYVFRAENSRLPWAKANFLRIFPVKVRPGCFMCWERLETFVRCAFAHFYLCGHGASLGEQSQSRCESLDWSGVGRVRMDDWTQCTRSDCSLMGTVSFSELFIHFKAFWACLVVIDTRDKAHRTHCIAELGDRREGERKRERGKSESASSSSVEVQGPRSRCQVLPEEVQKLDFLAFFERVQASPSGSPVQNAAIFSSAQGSSCLPEDSDRNASCLLGDFGAFLLGAFSSRREIDWGLMAIL